MNYILKICVNYLGYRFDDSQKKSDKKILNIYVKK